MKAIEPTRPAPAPKKLQLPIQLPVAPDQPVRIRKMIIPTRAGPPPSIQPTSHIQMPKEPDRIPIIARISVIAGKAMLQPAPVGPETSQLPPFVDLHDFQHIAPH